jgi:hypothetical protein
MQPARSRRWRPASRRRARRAPSGRAATTLDDYVALSAELATVNVLDRIVSSTLEDVERRRSSVPLLRA